MKKGDRIEAMWEELTWLPATFVKKSSVKGFVLVVFDGDDCETMVRDKDVRPIDRP